MKKNSTTVMILEPYPFDLAAGNRKTLLNILTFIDKTQFDLHLLVPFKTSLVETVQALATTVKILNFPSSLNQYNGKTISSGPIRSARLCYDLIVVSFKLNTFLRRHNSDVIFCNGIRANLICGLASLMSNVPIVWYVKGQLQNPILDLIGCLFAKRILFYSKVSVTDAHAYLRWFFKKKIIIVPTAVDVNLIQREARKKSNFLNQMEKMSAQQSLLLGCFGQIYRPKGIHILIEAFEKFLKVYPCAKLFVVGAPVLEEHKQYMKELEAQVVALSIEESVFFTGWRDDATALMARLDMVIHPSFAEGFSRVILEAMCLQKPIIATAVGAEKETIIDQKNGFLVRPGDVQQLVDTMIFLAGSKKIRQKVGIKAQKTVITMHSISDQIKKLEEVFRAV